MKLLLLLAFSLAAFGQCPISVTSSAGTTCLVGPPGPVGPQGPAGPQGPPGPAGAGISTITVSGATTTIAGNLVVTGTIQTGAANAPTIWNIVRSDGVACTVKFSPTNPASNTTSMVITCP